MQHKNIQVTWFTGDLLSLKVVVEPGVLGEIFKQLFDFAHGDEL